MLFLDHGSALIPPHRGHPGRSGGMACQPCPRQLTWLQRASRQPQGHGGRERKNAQVFRDYVSTHGASNEVWWSPYPTNLQPPIHHRQTPERTRVKTSSFVFLIREARAQINQGNLLPWICGLPPYSFTAAGDRSLMWVTGTPGCSTANAPNRHSLG